MGKACYARRLQYTGVMTEIAQSIPDVANSGPVDPARLLQELYEELRKLAASKLAHEMPGQTLQATALVHEAYLRLADARNLPQWQSRGHFFAAAAEAMRRILVERARKERRRELIRGARIPIELITSPGNCPSEHTLLLNDGLEKLEACNPSAAAIVKLRYFGGLSMKEVSESLDIPLRTAERQWTYARAWLHRELEKQVADASL